MLFSLIPFKLVLLFHRTQLSQRKRWTTAEKECLHHYAVGGIPNTDSGALWEECAIKLNAFVVLFTQVTRFTCKSILILEFFLTAQV